MPLRSYDPILGRFHSPDPYQQFHSPYLANFNNPANFADPSGGWGECFLEGAEAFFKNTKGAVGKNGFATGLAVVQTGMVALSAVMNIGGVHKDLANSVDQLAGEMAMATTGNTNYCIIQSGNCGGPEPNLSPCTYYYHYTDYDRNIIEFVRLEFRIVKNIDGEDVMFYMDIIPVEDIPMGATAQKINLSDPDHPISKYPRIENAPTFWGGLFGRTVEYSEPWDPNDPEGEMKIIKVKYKANGYPLWASVKAQENNLARIGRALRVGLKRATRMHHIATNKHFTRYTKLFKEITDKYGLRLNQAWNKMEISAEIHRGRHTIKYHEWVLDNMRRADQLSGGDTNKFLELFKEFVVTPLKNNPNLINLH